MAGQPTQRVPTQSQRQASQVVEGQQGGLSERRKRAAPESLDAQMPGGSKGSGAGSGPGKTCLL